MYSLWGLISVFSNWIRQGKGLFCEQVIRPTSRGVVSVKVSGGL